MNTKKTLLILGLFFLVAACSKGKKTNEALVGTWKLTEQLADPGDGSGVFVEVESDKTIEFFDDGTLVSNGNLCSIGSDTDPSTDGNYVLQDSTITIDDCSGIGGAETIIHFELSDNILILYFTCIEACAQKYIKVE